MVNLKIDGLQVSVPEGTTILEAAKTVGIHIPTLCYMKEINEIGACRVCVVEIKGNTTLFAACNTVVQNGMEVLTNSPRVRVARKVNVELILSAHNTECTSCVRNGNCKLQSLTMDLNITDIPYEVEYRKGKWDLNLPLIRDTSKCIKCMRCVTECEKVQSLGVWDVLGTGHRTIINYSGASSFRDTNCAFCGQCITHCPVGALRERDDTDRLMDALIDENKIVICQVAPAVRTAWGENLELDDETATVGRMVASLKTLGFDYVFDTDFSADLTIMEEGSELVQHLTNRDKYAWPMFTSCCPGWIRFVRKQYPEFLPNLSSAKSPQQMFGAVAKSYFAQILDVDPEKIFCVSIMPCLAKKWECDVPEVSTASDQDVDMVLTTREIARMLRASGVDLKDLEERDFDEPLGLGTGAGTIFGTTGGVMEAALRSAHFLITGKNPDADAFSGVRGMDGWKERTFTIDGNELRVAIAHGLGNARKLLEAIKAGKAQYDFVEIMACPGGCVGGGGQPIRDGYELAEGRAAKLRSLDSASTIRFSHENPFIQKLYSEYLETPMSHKAHYLLHTNQAKWTLDK